MMRVYKKKVRFNEEIKYKIIFRIDNQYLFEDAFVFNILKNCSVCSERIRDS
jgi:hypothetical protein